MINHRALSIRLIWLPWLIWSIQMQPSFAASVSGGSWSGDTAVLSLNSTSFPSGNIFNDNAQFAMSDWNLVPGSNFAFFVNSTNCNPTLHSSLSDQCVAFVSGSSIGGALAVTNFLISNGLLLDADVRFNANVLWVPGLDVDDFSFGPPFSFRGVARHEFGHALGLCHEDRAGNVVLMNSIYTAGGVKPANPHWDDRFGIRFLYSGAGSEIDLIAYMWKKTASDSPLCNSSSTFSVPVASVPSSVVAGNSLTMEYSFENAGNVGASSFQIGFYLSTNTTISTGDTLIGVNTGASAPSHSRGTFTRSLTIPVDTPPGNYSLGICVDSGSTVTESREFNNCARAPGLLTVTAAPNPDLVVVSPSVSKSSLTPGETFTQSATVRNQGTASSSSTTLRYFLSTNSTISPSDTQLSTDPVSALSPGATSPESNLQSIGSEGVFWVGACVDSVSGETNTSNNCSSGVQIVVSQPTEPDLTVTGIGVSKSALEIGETFTLSATVRNLGDATSGTTTLRYLRSSNSTISPSDTLLSTDAIPSLSPGSNSPQSDLESIGIEGTFWVGACVDSVSGETTTGNNCSSGVPVSVAACQGPADLELTNATISTTAVFEACDSIFAGPSFSIQAPGNVTLRAGSGVVLRNGFSVGNGGRLVVDTGN